MNVALVVKPSNSTTLREGRNMGYWSYPVEQFTWKHFSLGGDYGDGKPMNDFDIAVQEDAGPIYLKGLKKPLVFVDIDSTLSDDHHLSTRLKRAQKAALILVDQNKLDAFSELGKPVRRFNYCVNDRLFQDYKGPRTTDVSFHCAGGGLETRQKLRIELYQCCEAQGLVFTSGVLDLPAYARAMARSKIVVNWPRVYGNRPHRVFDAMACGACVVSGPLPEIDGDERVAGRDYVEVKELDHIIPVVKDLLKTGHWKGIAANGKRLVAKYHTWAIRAKQLKQIIREEL